MNTPHHIFSHFLATQNLKNTPQRRLIVDVFFTTRSHLSTEELYAKVKQIDKKVGQATVYRTLKLLCEAGLAIELNFGDGSARYEATYGKAHHDHLICTECEKNIEFVNDTIERLQVELAEKHGFTLNSHSLYLFGICPDCRAKKR